MRTNLAGEVRTTIQAPVRPAAERVAAKSLLPKALGTRGALGNHLVPAIDVEKNLHHRHGPLADECDRYRMGADVVACDVAGGVGGAQALSGRRSVTGFTRSASPARGRSARQSMKQSA